MTAPNAKQFISGLSANLPVKEKRRKLAEISGVPEEEVNDKNVGGVVDAVQGAGKVVQAGQDPRQVPIQQLKQAGNPEAPKKESPKSLGHQQMLFQSIAAIVPTLIGAVAGGAEGGALGAEVGGKAVKEVGDHYSQRETLARAEEKEDKADRYKEAQLEIQRQKADQDLVSKKETQDYRNRTLENQEQNTRIREKQVAQMGRGANRARLVEERAIKNANVPGYAVAEGATPTKEDASKVKAAVKFKADFDTTLQKLKDSVQQHGTESFGANADTQKQLATDLRIQAKELYNLGALSGPDMGLIEQTIPNPGDPSWAWTPNAKNRVLSLLTSAQKNVADKFQGGLQAMGYQTPAAAPVKQNTRPAPATQQELEQMSDEELSAYIGR